MNPLIPCCFSAEYPYMPVTMNSEFDITREKWKPFYQSYGGTP